MKKEPIVIDVDDDVVEIGEIESLLPKEEASEAQKSFNALSMESKFERLNKLVQQSQIYSKVILENMMAKAMSKKSENYIDIESPTDDPEPVPEQSSEPIPERAVRQSARLNKNSAREPAAPAKTKAKAKTAPKTKTRKSKRPAKETATFANGESALSARKTRQRLEAAQTSHSQKQPTMVSGCVMKDYQLDGLEWLVTLYENGLNGILADEMGLGKTLQCISLFGHLLENGVKGPFLVVAPLSTVGNWCKEFAKFAPEIRVLQYVGSKDRRSKIALKKTDSFDVVVTSYEIIIRDFSKFSRINWEYLTVDEGHRLKNFQSLLMRYLKRLYVGNRLLLTGTPLQNNLRELWSLLNFILPDIFHDLELFESWFDLSEFSGLGNEDVSEKEREFFNEKIQTEFVKHLHSILQPFLLRRLKEVVIKDLPPKKEYIVLVDLTTVQKLCYSGVINGHLHQTLVKLYLKEYLLLHYPQYFHDSISLEYVDEVLNAHFMNLTPKKRKRVIHYVDSESDPSDDDQFVESISKRTRTNNVKPSSSTMSETDEKDGQTEVASAETTPISISKEGVVKDTLKTIEGYVKNLSLQNTAMQLRNVCGSHYTYYELHPFDSTEESEFDREMADLLIRNSQKFQILEQLVTRLVSEKHKVLIFSQFTKILDLINLRFEEEGFSCSRLDGRMDHESRTDEIERFGSHGKNSTEVFLLSTRAGGLGLNLVCADTVILFDNDWNPQMDLQAIDRVHRIGQTKPVKIFRFMVRHTIEELLLLKSMNKRALEKLVIEKGNFHLGRMAKKLQDENIDLSTVDTFNSVIDLGHRLKLHGTQLDEAEELNINGVLTGEIEGGPAELTADAMEELMDRSMECYKREPKELENIISLESSARRE